MFNDRDKNLILDVHLSLSNSHDLWCWIFERDGSYSVKSAYNFLNNSQAEGNHGQHSLLKLIGSLKVPLKVKHMLWRASFNILPTCDNLL